jgi:hypothetical protein
MTKARIGIALLALAHGLAAGCSGSPSLAPTTVPQAQSKRGSLVGVTLYGVVSEVTAAGQQPIEGVSVYCDSCGELGHTTVTTDATGYYSFSADLAHGGGVWVRPGFTNPINVWKEGFEDPPGLSATPDGSNEPGWREVTIIGDTRFDTHLARR